MHISTTIYALVPTGRLYNTVTVGDFRFIASTRSFLSYRMGFTEKGTFPRAEINVAII